ncbi:uncharacterized protein LOC143027211 [Oratosquilla oratoria]|uniref:uncharacterized protein LOC143027211 n=1 Tax=Oratosquilla oratoria TaxID=337810 RepID=UPI003F76B709
MEVLGTTDDGACSREDNSDVLHEASETSSRKTSTDSSPSGKETRDDLHTSSSGYDQCENADPTSIPTTNASAIKQHYNLKLNTQPMNMQSEAAELLKVSSKKTVLASTAGVIGSSDLKVENTFEVAASVSLPHPASLRTRKKAKKLDRFKCHFCKKNCRSNSDLRNHKRSHTRERQFKCDVCDRDFIYKAGLVTHMRTHDPVNKYFCPLCGMSFNYKNDRNFHTLTHACERWRSHIRDSADAHVCSTCYSEFDDRDTLLCHVRQHDRGRDILCPVCSASFRGLKGHILVKHVRNAHPEYMTRLIHD